MKTITTQAQMNKWILRNLRNTRPIVEAPEAYMEVASGMLVNGGLKVGGPEACAELLSFLLRQWCSDQRSPIGAGVLSFIAYIQHTSVLSHPTDYYYCVQTALKFLGVDPTYLDIVDGRFRPLLKSSKNFERWVGVAIRLPVKLNKKVNYVDYYEDLSPWMVESLRPFKLVK